ncbi:MAG: UDP-N-acetylmuramate--L-alanine ligase [bacterium]|nr:UDP-N-acetylmuramate--L-alanine ligase [bacterium]
MGTERLEQPQDQRKSAQDQGEQVRYVYIVGIGGIGASAVAQWLHAQGWKVAGADRTASTVTEALARAGVRVDIGEVNDCPPDINLLMYSDAVPADHPIRAAARARGVQERSYAELLGELTQPLRTVAIAGSHGKSTTTAIVGLILETARQDPTVVVGSLVPQWQEEETGNREQGTGVGKRGTVGNFRFGSSDIAVVEADEYQRHFLHLQPTVALVTSLDHDHVDSYPTVADYSAAFVDFLQRVRVGGTVVLSAADPVALALRAHVPPGVRLVTYGIGESMRDADVHASEPTVENGRQTFRLTVRGTDWGIFVLPVPGRHVVLNAAGAIAATLPFQVSPEDARRALEQFRGIWRRFERVGDLNGAPVISDYAHHPTELRALAAAARQWYPNRRLVMAFQPHHRARAVAFHAEFVKALALFDAVVLAEVYDVAGREDTALRVTTRDWVDELRKLETEAQYAATLPELEALLRQQARPDDVLLLTGAGTIDSVARRLASLPHPTSHFTLPVEERVSLARYSGLHVEGQARYFIRVADLETLRVALAWADDRGLPWFILGGGTNFFCREEGYQGLIIKMENRSLTFEQAAGNPTPLKLRGAGGEQEEMTADAGVITRLAVTNAVRRGLRGMERLAGIPGTIGGAVRGNAGAFGMETKDRLARVRVLRRAQDGWREDILPKESLDFAYRTSPFKREPKNFVIWSATFALPSGDPAEGERLVQEDLAARRAKQPYEFPSVGSVFKNPSPDRSAGSLIEAAGLKSHRIGGAEISTKHANFIVNRGGATATDVLALIAEIKRRVFDASGIALEEEIVIL